ncbi:hypothetical protein U2F26_35355 [Micromonospora sp. 4G57]|uniref:Secreted protein n=1 Tax=Micromonospora sicca TaxID=2202420 RepID=A0ABU5JPU9_9ACTN|nr:hypothetical protein [Micromonospora sp. 4G53]MDZ5447913.1 hypothetical protein [Micromonospora sp. 4G57]MDZ5494663.1 hypothetical protein [Micromonospora sp. 4G53]
MVGALQVAAVAVVVGLVRGDDVESEPPQQWIGHIVGNDGKQAEAFVRHGRALSSVVSAAGPDHWDRRRTRSTLTFA